MIFTVYALAKSEMVKMSGISNNDVDGCSVLVVSPLKSIINDQLPIFNRSTFPQLNCRTKHLRMLCDHHRNLFTPPQSNPFFLFGKFVKIFLGYYANFIVITILHFK